MRDERWAAIGAKNKRLFRRSEGRVEISTQIRYESQINFQTESGPKVNKGF